MRHRMKLCVIAAFVLVTGLGQAVAADQMASGKKMGFFVTSAGSGKGADLGGLEGADKHCQSLAQAAGAKNRIWRAYLSASATGSHPGDQCA